MTSAAPPSDRIDTSAIENDGAAIDLEGGVQRVMGDQKMYARVLERFRSDYRRAPASIRAALAAGDTVLAQRLAHTLKGASGMIEARALQREALALEVALRGQAADWPQQLDRVEGELDRVLQELDGALANGAVEAAQPSISAPAQPDALERLRALLDVGDGAAVDLLEEARASLVAALGEVRFREVAAAIGEFDFERALELAGQPADR
jgi:HPt (histidine-containing phosphotransfer) domain-containing protein